MIIVYTDGGARGNPGPAAIGVVIEISDRKRKQVIELSKRIGETTNNVAEYKAVIEAISWLRNNPIIPASPAGGQSTNNPIIQFYLDSSLVVHQLNGTFKVKEAKLRELLMSVRVLEQELPATIIYTYVPREQNRRADYLVNKALDEMGPR